MANPESPLGQEFKDMDPAFAVLRGDFVDAIGEHASAEQAAVLLFNMHAAVTAKEGGIQQHQSIKKSPVGDAFFKHTVRQFGFYHALFTIMKELGLGKKAALQAVDACIKTSTKFAVNMSMEARLRASILAQDAGEYIYADGE